MKAFLVNAAITAAVVLVVLAVVSRVSFLRGIVMGSGPAAPAA